MTRAATSLGTKVATLDQAFWMPPWKSTANGTMLSLLQESTPHPRLDITRGKRLRESAASTVPPPPSSRRPPAAAAVATPDSPRSLRHKPPQDADRPRPVSLDPPGCAPRVRLACEVAGQTRRTCHAGTIPRGLAGQVAGQSRRRP